MFLHFLGGIPSYSIPQVYNSTCMQEKEELTNSLEAVSQRSRSSKKTTIALLAHSRPIGRGLPTFTSSRGVDPLTSSPTSSNHCWSTPLCEEFLSLILAVLAKAKVKECVGPSP